MKRLMLLGVAVCLVCMPAGAVHKNSASFICSGCHVMHATDGDGVDLAAPVDLLLKNTSTEALCLNCHDEDQSPVANTPCVMGAALSTAPAGGSFENLSAKGNDTAGTWAQGTGHNLGEGGLVPIIPASTGMTLPNGMDCATCHDPHGTSATEATDDAGPVDAYRNLRQAPGVTGGATARDIIGTEGAFVTDVIPAGYNAYGALTSANGSDFTRWCGECHNDLLDVEPGVDDGAEPFHRHPVAEDMVDDAPADDMAPFANYGTTTAEASRLPLEDWTGSASANTTNGAPLIADGDEAADRVFCLSCHSAHASGELNALRWDNTAGLGNTVGCQQCHLK